MNIKPLYLKYKDVISYLFWGVTTTVINVVVYFLCHDVAEFSNLLSTVFAWIVAVTVAFVTNKIFVFGSKSWHLTVVFREMIHFIIYRLGTGVIELLMMYIFVDVLTFDGTIMKIITNIVVIILNYVASKFVIFKKK